MAERSCTPAPSRRALFSAAVALPVLTATPALAASHLHDAGASPDAELLRIADRQQRLQAEIDSLDAETDRLFTALLQARPERPAAVFITKTDVALFGYGPRYVGCPFSDRQLEELGRRMPDWLSRKIATTPELRSHINYACLDRAAEVLNADASWRRALAGPDAAHAAAVRPIYARVDVLMPEVERLEAQILELPAHTLAGVAAKARIYPPPPAPAEGDEPEHYAMTVLRSIHADLQRMEA